MDRRAAGALLALAACIACSAAAPTASNHTALDLYEGAPEGCYYNFQHYGEGDRIMTNEPCLNCTCHNRMLMCYLRVCPFTKAIGQDCTVEKRADQCCPIVTCPDVPVDLLTSTSTTSPAEYGATGLGKLDKYGCSINGKYISEGSKVPPTPNKPCEHCYCIRNMTTCVMQECTLHVDGCTPIYHKDVCCPVRYSCDHPEDEVPLLDDMSTTVRPTPGFLLTTTTISPVTQMTQDCVHDDQVFADGALIKTEKACEHCYCMKGDIVCVVQECGAPMENEGKNCTSLPPREGQCCPDTYICEGDELTSDLPTDSTTESIIEKLTTLSPPRRTSVEGSGYRNEPDEAPYTEMPIIESEVEGSGEEQEPAKPLGPDEIIPGSEDSDQYIYVTTKAPAFEKHEQTTEEMNKDIITDMEDKIVTVEPHVYISTTNAPVSEEMEKFTTTGMIEEEILEPHEHVPATKAPESYESVTTELGESLTTVPDTLASIGGEDNKLTSSEKDITTSTHPETTEPESSTTSSLHEIEKETATPAEISNVTPEVITEKEYYDGDITRTTIATIIKDIESPAEEEKESSEPEKLAPSTTSSPLEEGQKLTTEPDNAQNTVAVAEEESTHSYSPILTTTIALPSVEEESTTVINIEKDVVTEKDSKKDVLAPHEHITTKSPAFEDTEPDRGLNTIPNEIDEETSSEPSPPGRTTLSAETKGTEPSFITDKMQTQAVDIKLTTVSEITTLLPDSIITKGDQISITTEPSFRKEDESIVSTEKLKDIEPTTVRPEFVDEGLIPTSSHDEKIATSSDAPSIEEEFTTLVPEYITEVAETIGSKQTTTESPKDTSVVTEKVSEPSLEADLSFTTEKAAEVTTLVGTYEEPSRIPGEGDCLLNGVTYRNNTVVPSTNNCHTGCRCASSIIKCDPIICSPPPDYMDNCQSIYDSPDSCCPTYVCDHPRETVPPQSDNQMSGTESPMPSPTIECRGDQCEIIETTKQPAGSSEICTSGSCSTGADHKPEIECGSEGCGDVLQKPDTSLPSVEQTEKCTDGKCKPEDCANGECQLPQTQGQVSPVRPCESEHCENIDEVTPELPQLCKNEEDCKTLEIANVQPTPCEGESCHKIDCGDGGCGSDVIVSPPTNQLELCKGEDGCKPLEIPVPDCNGDEPCRRKEISTNDEKLPPACEGSNCINKMETTIAQGIVDASTESPQTEQVPSKEITEMTVPTEEEKVTELPDSHISKPDDEKIPAKDTQETDTYITESPTDTGITDVDTQKEKPLIEDEATKKPTTLEEKGTEIPAHIGDIDEKITEVEGEITVKPTIIEKEGTESPDVIEEGTEHAVIDEKGEEPMVVQDKGTKEPTLTGDEGEKKPTIDRDTTELPTVVSEEDTEKPAIIDEDGKEKPIQIDEESTKKSVTVEEEGTVKPVISTEEATKIPDFSEAESSDKPMMTDEKSTDAPAIIDQESTDIPATVAEVDTKRPSLIDEEGKDKPIVIEKDSTEKPAIVEDGMEKPLVIDEGGKDKPSDIDVKDSDKPVTIDDKEKPVAETATEELATFDGEDKEKPVEEIATEKPTTIDDKDKKEPVEEIATEKPATIDDKEKEKPIEAITTEKPALIEQEGTDKPVDEEKATEKPDVIKEESTAKPVVTDKEEKEKPAGEEEFTEKPTDVTEKVTGVPTLVSEDGEKEPEIIAEDDKEKPAVIDKEGTEKPDAEDNENKPAVFEQEDTEKPTTIDKEGTEKPLAVEDDKKEPVVVEQESTEKTAIVDEERPEKAHEIEEAHKEKPSVVPEESTAKPALVDEEKSSESPAITIDEGTEVPDVVDKDTEKPAFVTEDGKEKPAVVEMEITKKPTDIEKEGTELPVIVEEENTEKPVISDEDTKEKPVTSVEEAKEKPVILDEEGMTKPAIDEEDDTIKPFISEEESTAAPDITEDKGTAKPALIDEGTEEPIFIVKEDTTKPTVIEMEGTELPTIGEEDTEKTVIIDEGVKEKPDFPDQEGTKKPAIVEEGTDIPAIAEVEGIIKPAIIEESSDKPEITGEDGTEEPATFEKEGTVIPEIVEEVGTEKPVLIDEEGKVKPVDEEHTKKPVLVEEKGQEKPVVDAEEEKDKTSITDAEVTDKPTVNEVESTEQPKIHEEGSGTDIPIAPYTNEPEKEIEKTTKTPSYESQTTLAGDIEHTYTTESNAVDVSTLAQEIMPSEIPEINVLEPEDSESKVPDILDHSHTPEITTKSVLEQDMTTEISVPEHEKETISEQHVEVTTSKSDIKEESSTTLTTKAPELHETSESVEKTTEIGSISEHEEVFTDISEIESPTTKAPGADPVLIEPEEGLEPETPELPVTSKTEEDSTTKLYEEDKIKPIPESHVTEASSTSSEYGTSDRVTEALDIIDEDKRKPELPKIHDTEPDQKTTQLPVDEIKTDHPNIYSSDKEETITETPAYSVTEPVRRFTEIEDPSVTGQEDIATAYTGEPTEHHVPTATEKIDESVDVDITSTEKPLLTDMGISPALLEESSESEKPVTKMPEQGYQTPEAEKDKPTGEFESPATEKPISVITETEDVSHVTVKDIISYEEKTTTAIPDLSDQKHKDSNLPEGYTESHEPGTEIPQHHFTAMEEHSKATESYVTVEHVTEPQETSIKTMEQEVTHAQTITTDVPSISEKEEEVKTKAPELMHTESHDVDNKEPSIEVGQKLSTELPTSVEDVQTELPGVQITSEVPQSLVTEQKESLGERTTVSTIPKEESSFKPELLTTQFEESSKAPELHEGQDDIRTETPVHITESVELSTKETKPDDKIPQVSEETVTEKQDSATTLRESPTVTEEIGQTEVMKSTEHTPAQTEFSETTPYLIELEEHTHKIVEDITTLSPSEEHSYKPVEGISTSSTLEEYTYKPVDDISTSSPSDEEHSYKPVEDISTSSPSEEEHSYKPVKDISTSPPSEEEHSYKPVEDISTSSPSEEEHSYKPVEDISTSSPSVEEHSYKPVEDVSASSPSEEEHSYKPVEDISTSSPSIEEHSYKPTEDISTSSPQEYTSKIEEHLPTESPYDDKHTTVHPEAGQEPQISELTTKITDEEIETVTKEAEASTMPSEVSSPEDVSEKISESVPVEETTPAVVKDEDNKYTDDHKEYITSPPTQITEESTAAVVTESEKIPISESDITIPTEKEITSSEKPLHPIVSHETTAPEEEFIFSTTKATTQRQEEDIVTPEPEDKFTKAEEKPIETSDVPPSSATTEVSKPSVSDLQPTDEVPVPEDDGHFPSSETSGYGEPDYVEEDQAFGPGTCRYGGKVYVSAQQIPRDDPCDFCFCFRSDIICLQQSCPPPIHGCHEEPIQGFCCPRYECPVSMATTVNVTTTTTTTTTTLPPHFPTHSYKGAAHRRGCQIKGHTYKVGEVVRSSSGPCLHCTCGGDGQMKCDPKACTPEPMLRQMIAAAVSAKRRR